MPLNQKATKNWQNFNIPLSYRVDEDGAKLRDALNVFSNQGRLETRNGTSRYNAVSLGGSILSSSFFRKTDGTKILIAKVGDSIYKVNSTGAHDVLISGLNVNTRHHGVTLNNRHILSVGTDEFYSYDGTTFTQLGQEIPVAPTLAAIAGSLTDSEYEVAITYVASGIGYESNRSSDSNNITTTGQGLNLTGIPTTATNALVDKIGIYLRDVTANGSYIFVKEVNLGIASTTIIADPTSTLGPPTTSAPPLDGGGTFMTVYNSQLVYVGNDDFRNDAFKSETDDPDAWGTVGAPFLTVPGNGHVTGVATGFFNDTKLAPYLVFFKRSSTHIWDGASFSTLDDKVGCVSGDTVSVRNGDVYFLSNNGWRVVSNGKLVSKDNNPITLGNGDIDDIFKSPGYVYEVNKQNFENFFSFYYQNYDQYVTMVSEGASLSINKAYNYQFGIRGFHPYSFNRSFNTAVAGEDSADDEVIYLGDTEGYFFTHSDKETRSDEDETGAESSISVFAQMAWLDGGDRGATYNFRDLHLQAIASDDALEARFWVGGTLGFQTTNEYTFPDPSSGFILDFSKLDEGIFSDGRTLVLSKADVNRSGYNLLIGFYQDIINSNINLVKAQLEFNTNGNTN